MPDESMTEAFLEAAALAPADERIYDTFEFRHDDFVDDNGDPDSLRLVADTQDLVAPLEADAPIKGGQWVTFGKAAFSYALIGVEAGATGEMSLTFDAVNRAIITYLDIANESGKILSMAYRPYLDSDIADGPQMDPVLVFEIVDITLGASSVTLKARAGVDLRIAFPRRVYTITEFPGLAGR